LLAAFVLTLAPAHAREPAPKSWTLQEAIGGPEGLTVSGSIRARYEALGNQFRPGLDRNDDLVTFRTSLFAEYDSGPLRFGGEIIDSRAYDADAGSPVGTGEVNALEFVQAYAGLDLDDGLGAGSLTALEFGRFTMDLGSRRLVARNAFRNTTNAFTGARLRFLRGTKDNLTLFYTFPHQRQPADKRSVLDNDIEWDREGKELKFWGGFFGKGGLPDRNGLQLYFLALEEKDSARLQTRNRTLYTPGLRLFRDPKPGTLDYEIESAYQFGTIRASVAPDAARMDVSAWFLHAELGRQWDMPWQPRLSAEFDIASGDGPGGSYGRFDTLFGARRGDFGPTSIYGPLGRGNIISPGVRLEVKPDSRWDGFAAYRAAWLENDADSFSSTGVRDASGGSGAFGGQQIELRARYWIIPKLLRAEAGGAVFFQCGFLKNAPNANGYGDARYGYFDLTATF